MINRNDDVFEWVEADRARELIRLNIQLEHRINERGDLEPLPGITPALFIIAQHCDGDERYYRSDCPRRCACAWPSCRPGCPAEHDQVCEILAARARADHFASVTISTVTPRLTSAPMSYGAAHRTPSSSTGGRSAGPGASETMSMPLNWRSRRSANIVSVAMRGRWRRPGPPTCWIRDGWRFTATERSMPPQRRWPAAWVWCRTLS